MGPPLDAAVIGRRGFPLSPNNFRQCARPHAIVLAILLLAGGLLSSIPTVRAPFVALTVTPGQFSRPELVGHPFVYVPGESVSFVLSGSNPGDVFDGLIVHLGTGAVLQAFDDVVVPGGLSVTLTYIVPPGAPDDDDYGLEVGDSNWIQSSRTTTRYALQQFAVQEYTVIVDVNRLAFIGGDEVTVRWSANALRDGALSPQGFGQLWAYDSRGVSFLTTSPFVFSSASSSMTFRIPDVADPRFDGTVLIWFNNTAVMPTRLQSAQAQFRVTALGAVIDGSSFGLEPGSVIRVNVKAIATDTPPGYFWSDPPAPGVLVDITVWELPPAGPVLWPQYGAAGLVTDEGGYARHAFQLDPGIVTGTTFEVRANATTVNRIWMWTASASLVVPPIRPD